jgi:hypothetical protein
MLKIINSPPFDDYSKRLFYQTFGRKHHLGLRNASFVYLWSGPLSNENYCGYSDKSLVNSNIHELPNFSRFFLQGPGRKVSGNNRYFNNRDDLYLSYCDFANLSNTEELYDIFCNHYQKYSENLMDRTVVEDMIQEACVNDIVVIFVKDHFRIETKNSWVTTVPELSIYFNNLCEYYPNKRFIIVTSLENLHKEINKDNCTIIPMGGDITNQIDSYMQHTPNVDKNTDAKNFISLNRGPRYHRTYLVSGLYGRMLDKHGDSHHLTWPAASNLRDVIKYDYLNDRHYETADHGFIRYSKLEKTLDSVDIYELQNDNLTNFKESLQSKYNNSIIEFVSETSYNEHSFNITEKTMHFIYGCNFPIMISSPGTVDFLRNMGIDMFDDIVNHSYDTITDPAERINAAIDLNLDILTSPNMLERWKQHKYRMDQNIAFVKEGKLREYYSDRFWNTLKETRI